MKAILVIDTTKCGGCPFCHKGAYYSWCDAPRKERSWEMPLTSKDIEEERTVECPLRPLPEKQKLTVTGKNQIETKRIIKCKSLEQIKKGFINNSEVAFYCGYNACRSEVAGETE